MKISTTKTKTKAFFGRGQVRSKIIIASQPIEQFAQFDYFECTVSYNHHTILNEKLAKFVTMYGRPTIGGPSKGKVGKIHY